VYTEQGGGGVIAAAEAMEEEEEEVVRVVVEAATLRTLATSSKLAGFVSSTLKEAVATSYATWKSSTTSATAPTTALSSPSSGPLFTDSSANVTTTVPRTVTLSPLSKSSSSQSTTDELLLWRTTANSSKPVDFRPFEGLSTSTLSIPTSPDSDPTITGKHDTRKSFLQQI
jgi:hypothetical protein